MTPVEALLDRFDEVFGNRPPTPLGVAVSGGSDSLGLLYLLHAWDRAELHAVTVDHRLRRSSAGEALHVAALCEGLGVPHHVLEWRGWDGKGNLQAEARRNRYALMAEWASERGFAAVALGHTMDDQAETVLMRLAREAGVDGLSGMATETTRGGVRFVRPLLGVRRAALKAFLEALGVRWIDDPSNEDEAYERVRARRVLAAVADLGIGAETLAGVASNQAEARAALSLMARDFVQNHARIVSGDVIFDRARLNRLPAEIHRRVLSGALTWISSSDYPPRRDALRDLLAACHEGRNVTLHGARVLVSTMGVRVVREHAAVSGLIGPTDQTWDRRWTLDGHHAADLEVRVLGEAVAACPDWRETGLPRASLLASPAIWRGDTLVAAPVAGLPNGWTATSRGIEDFASSFISH